jgi:hypothetical protein
MAAKTEAQKTCSVRLVHYVPEPLASRRFIGEIRLDVPQEWLNISRLGSGARVDIAGVASSILATPTILSL